MMMAMYLGDAAMTGSSDGGRWGTGAGWVRAEQASI
jgi:hypothetical protein